MAPSSVAHGSGSETVGSALGGTPIARPSATTVWVSPGHGARLRPASLYPHARGSVLVPLALLGLQERLEAAVMARVAGALSFDVGGEHLVATEHCCVFVPGGQPHTVANLGQDEVRWLTVCTPPPAGDVVLGRGMRDGPRRLVDGLPGRVKVLVRGSDGSGRVAVMDNVIEVGHEGPPLHHHPFDEAFYVLDGVLTFRLHDRDVTCRAGELAFAPAGCRRSSPTAAIAMAGC